MRILLIEDDDDHAEIILRRLANIADVDEKALKRATTWRQAQELLTIGQFDVVLLDLHLPDGSIDETLAGCVSLSGLAPVIVLTALDDQSIAASCLSKGAQDYIIKTDFGTQVATRAITYAIERKKQSSKIDAYMKKLQQKNIELEEYASLISHDLQAPLRQISQFSQLLRNSLNDELEDEQRLYFQFIEQGADDLRAMVAGILAYTRIGAEDDLNQNISLQKVFRKTQERLTNEIKESNAQISIFKEEVQVRGNELLLISLFQNLISNALKFQIHSNIPQINILLEKADSHQIVICVDDNGIGISPENRAKVFQMFIRLHSTSEFQGTGIGLALCRRIVERLSGIIELEDSPLGGVRIKLVFARG